MLNKPAVKIINVLYTFCIENINISGTNILLTEDITGNAIQELPLIMIETKGSFIPTSLHFFHYRISTYFLTKCLVFRNSNLKMYNIYMYIPMCF